jgi:glutathione S-transferase
MLRLYHAWASTCSQKVRLALAEKDLVYEGVVLNLRRFEQLAPDFLAINPDGVVPVLVHDGFVVRESTIINDYIEDAFPERPLRPADAKGRARVAAWNRFVDEVPTLAIKKPSFQRNMRPFLQSLPQAEIDAAVRRMPNPQTARRWRDAARNGIPAAELAAADADLRNMLARMQETLARETWLAGDAYSLADINIAPFVHRLASFPDYDLGRDWPAVAGWYARLRARPAFARANFAEQVATRDQPEGLHG